MKAILIEEERFAEITELLKAKCSQLMVAEPDARLQQVIQDTHRCFHFHLVRWAQSHGASCVPR